ncbi:hypothetical protein BDY19DRAFT_968829 [Irpex rosettiformis]|uniref:Uncharacterized protein n=1 Tax=Irpex rosettiformis TaxID=378272 RepID=A0ACB8TS83_9APHY|nr:hypothetical protein BDY19DRAFT_968829 [Irpex rosettiformis]
MVPSQPSVTRDSETPISLSSCITYGGKTKIEIDLSKSPMEHARTRYARYTITQPPVNRLRLISRDFPWAIEIDQRESIKCSDVWKAIYESFQSPIERDEWAIVDFLQDKDQMYQIERACRKRLERSPNEDSRVRRVDWLSGRTEFRGLYRDDEFVNRRHPPGNDTDGIETLVVRMGRPKR